MVPEPPPGEVSVSPTFDSFDDFIKQALKDYYDRGWKTRKGNFVALLVASGQTVAMARDSLSGGKGLQRAAIGAAGLVALRIGLSFALTGPLGLLVTGVAAVSLVAFFVKNQKEISQKLPRYRTLIADARVRFEEIQSGYRANRYAARERNLMVDGLLKRFVADCDEA
jgi:hypothetical protein